MPAIHHHFSSAHWHLNTYAQRGEGQGDVNAEAQKVYNGATKEMNHHKSFPNGNPKAEQLWNRQSTLPGTSGGQPPKSESFSQKHSTCIANISPSIVGSFEGWPRNFLVTFRAEPQNFQHKLLAYCKRPWNTMPSQYGHEKGFLNSPCRKTAWGFAIKTNYDIC